MTEDHKDERPNIVFFMVDQLSAKWLEAAWAGVFPTPNIDRLCAEGVAFTRAITSNPVCMPTRATMATGLTTRGRERGPWVRCTCAPILRVFIRTITPLGST
jgi:hypothetical protein